ncbi:hypothetical protein ABID56_001667 [Alkalibacillus flavidus]|uniref:DUF3231 family protein n=1 Tax=Alkalibacillus flavidus TaxID=546021 RepID=A0ABV2KVF3_9BACI
MSNTHVKLIAPELSQLWTDYLSDTLISCFLKHFEQHVQDGQISSIIRSRIEVTEQHITFIKDQFDAIGYPIPVGFNENEDVDVKADRLFTDHYMIEFLRQLSHIFMQTYSTAVGFATRPDIYQFYVGRMQDAQQLNEQVTSLSIEQGVMTLPPALPIPHKPDFVKKKNFLTGWFGQRRPVTGMEITFLFSNIQRNALGGSDNDWLRSNNRI